MNSLGRKLHRLQQTLYHAARHGFSSTPDFTTKNFRVEKGRYRPLEEHHLIFFRNLLGENRLVMDLDELEKYNVDWLRQLRGNGKLVLKPKTTEEVSKILTYCNTNRLAVCPQGGNTGLVGGGIPVFDEIIISTQLMNQILDIDEAAGVLVCQSGCILENLNNELEKYDLMVPVDLGAKGSCHIGGNVSTNAGGLRLLRYGNLHGVEIVTGEGKILDCLSTLKKDNTGYHLKHLFIGSEGTLGFLTKVAIQCPVKPKSTNIVFLGLQSYEKVLKTYKQAKSDLAEILSAVEVIDGETFIYTEEKVGIKSPIGDYPFYMLIETNGSNSEHDVEKLEKFLDIALVKHLALNGTIASEPSKVKEIWKIREGIPDSFTKEDHVFIYDFTLNLTNYFTLIQEFRDILGSKAKSVFGFGHLGDGNLHMQIVVEEYNVEIQEYIESTLYKRVADLQGSISAEHGIGFLKSKYMKDVKSENVINLMRSLKKHMDPNGILNPYKCIYVEQ